MKKFIRSIALMLCAVMMINYLSVFTYTVKAAEEAESLTNVVLCDDGDRMVIALVEDSYAEKYADRILTDSNFKLEELNKANPNARLPEGEIMWQKYLNKDGIKQYVDRQAGAGAFLNFMSNPITEELINRMIKASKCSNVWAFAAGVLVWTVTDLMNRQQNWWTQSLLMILLETITCVRITHIRNTTSDYPAAYLIIERI